MTEHSLRYRRRFMQRTLAAAALLGAPPLFALSPESVGPRDDLPRLDTAQSQAMRAWIVRIADEQLQRGPTPRWTHRDCAGLVRFAVAEALAEHDARWLKAMGMRPPLPPEIEPATVREALRHNWRRPDGSHGAFVTAQALIQENCRFSGHDLRQARAADLLFFNQGEAQHLMLWTGARIVYHNGADPHPDDDGLRAVTAQALLAWHDTRWRPDAGNPNFAGIYTLAFLR